MATSFVDMDDNFDTSLTNTSDHVVIGHAEIQTYVDYVDFTDKLNEIMHSIDGSAEVAEEDNDKPILVIEKIIVTEEEDNPNEEEEGENKSEKIAWKGKEKAIFDVDDLFEKTKGIFEEMNIYGEADDGDLDEIYADSYKYIDDIVDETVGDAEIEPPNPVPVSELQHIEYLVDDEPLVTQEEEISLQTTETSNLSDMTEQEINALAQSSSIFS